MVGAQMPNAGGSTMRSTRTHWVLSPAVLPAVLSAVLLLALPAVTACGGGGSGAGAPTASPAASPPAEPKAGATIGVFQYGPDPSTKAAYDGLLEGLAEAGYVEGENLTVDFRDCGGDQATIEATAREFAAAGLDAVVPLTTPCLVAAATYVKDTPVVFTSVYDPMAAGVAASPEDHPANLTGVYSPPPVEATVALIASWLPDVRVVGTAYNPDEANSSSAVARMGEACAAHGRRLAKLTVRSAADVAPGLEAFLGGGQQAGGAGDPGVLYVTGDNTVMGEFAAVARLARRAGVPLFINDVSFVGRGAVAGLGPDFAHAGVAGGRLLARVLDGADPASLPLHLDDATLLSVNEAAARAVGLEIPEAVRDRATSVQ